MIKITNANLEIKEIHAFYIFSVHSRSITELNHDQLTNHAKLIIWSWWVQVKVYIFHMNFETHHILVQVHCSW